MPYTAQLAGLAGLPLALAEFGVAPGPLLAKVGLGLEDLSVADRRVDVGVVDDLLGLCVDATGCAHFGLLAGARGNGLRSAGILGAAARHAATVGEALADLTRLGIFADPMGLFACEVHGREAIFSYALQAPGLQRQDQLYDLILALMRSAMRELVGPTWTPNLVYVPRRRPHDLEPYREALGPHLKFDATRAGLLFQAELLAAPVPDADPARRRSALEGARAAAGKREPAVFVDVRRAIRSALENGRCSRAEVARRLGLHERAFSRRLRAHGTSFQEILEATRLNFARELLAFTRVPVGRIAIAIGYQDATVFGRAFRRWAGMTPSEYRAAAVRSPEPQTGHGGEAAPPDAPPDAPPGEIARDTAA